MKSETYSVAQGLANRKSYYRALEAAHKHIEITDWLAWFVGMAIQAQEDTAALVEFLIDKATGLPTTRPRGRRWALCFRLLGRCNCCA